MRAGRVGALLSALGVLLLPLIGVTPAAADTAGPTPVTVAAPAGGAVTVSQAADLVDQTVHVSWTGFKPSSTPVVHPASTEYVVRVYECRGTAPTGPKDCYGSSVYAYPGQSDPTQVLPDGPTNALDAATDPSGAGSVDVEVRTGQESSSLGCDVSTPCSLVVIPNDGQPGQHATDFIYATNSYMDSTWAWADHVTIPLAFAPTGDSCPLGASSISLNGGPMLERAVTSWQPQICQTTTGVALDYTAIGETQGRAQFLSGTADVGLTADPASAGSATRAYGYAPMAVDGIAVAFHIDDATTGQPINSMTLSPRLIAKMLTESYGEVGYVAPGQPVGTGNPATAGNPYSLFTDPEFLALNPGHSWPSTSTNPLVMSGNNDMVYELTRWLNSDHATRTWLDGSPDQYGMHVNTHDKGVSWPTTSLELRDPYPALSFVFVPLEGLSNVARSLVANQPSSSSPTADELGRHAKDPQQLPGQRSLIAIVDTANAAAFNFPLAALRNAAGTDVIPTTASLTAGLAAMTTTSAGTLQPNPASADPAAYPLTLVQYAMAPTSGTAHAKAAQIARFLSYAADQGQVTGGLQGGLPAGYLPLTATLRTQVAQVADAVLHQTGKPPATTTPTPPVVPVTGTGGGAGSGDLGNPFPDGGSTPTTAPTTPAPAATPTASPSATASRTSPKLNAIDYTPPRSTAGAARLIVPFIIALTVSTGLVGPALLAMGSDRRRVVLASTRDAVHRVLRRRRPS